MTRILFLLYMVFPLFSFSQGLKKTSVSTFNAIEDSLKPIAKTILHGKTDKERFEANSKFISILERALVIEESFTYPFDSLTTVARLIAPDHSFRIFNWHLPKEDGTYEYFGYIQTNFKTKKKPPPSFYQLKDGKTAIKQPYYKTVDHTQWYGAHYYKIIATKHKKKRIYTLLGWDGNDLLSTKKVIDILSFTSEGSPQFGSPVFKFDKKMQSRVVFEYSKDVSMSLRFDEEQKQIVFDHLSPSHPQLEGQYQFYGPDFSYDAFKFEKGKWIYAKDIDARNPKNSKDKLINVPK